MWEKIPKEHRRKFIISSFIFMPISFILGLSIAALLVKFIGFEIEFGGALFAILLAMMILIASLVAFYRKLTKKNPEEGNKV